MWDPYYHVLDTEAANSQVADDHVAPRRRSLRDRAIGSVQRVCSCIAYVFGFFYLVIETVFLAINAFR
jgi:hypothetical protein